MVYLPATSNGQPLPFPPGLGAPSLPPVENPPEVRLVEAGSAGRAELEQYIHNRFAREYNANINKYMPFLIQYRSNLQTYAALGFRTAADHRLFLETYLNRPVEETLKTITGLDIHRGQIVEVGNLAATRAGSSAPLFGVLACFLDRVGYDWVVICATPTVQNIFSKLHIPLIGLAEAGESALPDDQKSLWGTYYHTRPLVMAVHVRTAHRCIRESVIGKPLLDKLSPSIDAMVAVWSMRHA